MYMFEGPGVVHAGSAVTVSVMILPLHYSYYDKSNICCDTTPDSSLCSDIGIFDTWHDLI